MSWNHHLKKSRIYLLLPVWLREENPQLIQAFLNYMGKKKDTLQLKESDNSCKLTIRNGEV